MLQPRYYPAETRHSRLIVSPACLSFVLLFGCVSAYALFQTPATTDVLEVSEVVANARKAIGYDKIKKLKRGFAVEEMRNSADSTGVTVRMFGRGGAVRQEAKPQDSSTFAFDGKELWMINRSAASARSGSPYPVNQKQLEKLVLPWWVQSGWWLDENAPLDIAVLPGESNEKRVSLSVKFKDGVVGSKLLVDRATWLPVSLAVEQAKGYLTLELEDYQKTSLGFLFPHRLKVNYDNSDREYSIKSVTGLPATDNLFRKLPPTGDVVFDNRVPAELKIARGERDADGTLGHAFARPLVDGKDVGWFHFDTGADNMMIDNRIADELKMPVIGESEAVAADGKVRKVTVRKGRTFQLGRVTVKDPVYIADDLSGMSAPPGEKRAGFIGYPLLARAVAEVIRGGEGIALYDPSTYRLPEGRWQNLSLVNYKPSVTARLEGNREGLFMLDTGASKTVDINSPFSKENRLLENRKTIEQTAASSGGNFKKLLGSLEWFELAGYKFKNPKVSFRIAGAGYEAEGVAGVVGREFMTPFTIVFNYPERRISFIR